MNVHFVKKNFCPPVEVIDFAKAKLSEVYGKLYGRVAVDHVVNDVGRYLSFQVAVELATVDLATGQLKTAMSALTAHRLNELRSSLPTAINDKLTTAEARVDRAVDELVELVHELEAANLVNPEFTQRPGTFYVTSVAVDYDSPHRIIAEFSAGPSLVVNLGRNFIDVGDEVFDRRLAKSLAGAKVKFVKIYERNLA